MGYQQVSYFVGHFLKFSPNTVLVDMAMEFQVTKTTEIFMPGWKGGYVDLHQVWPTYIFEFRLFIIYPSRWIWCWIEIRKANYYTLKITYWSKSWAWVITVFFSIHVLHCYRGDQTVHRGQLFGRYKHLFAALLRSVTLRLTAFFGSISRYEEAFSEMKVIKSRYRSRLTNKHLKY